MLDVRNRDVRRWTLTVGSRAKVSGTFSLHVSGRRLQLPIKRGYPKWKIAALIVRRISTARLPVRAVRNGNRVVFTRKRDANV